MSGTGVDRTMSSGVAVFMVVAMIVAGLPAVADAQVDEPPPSLTPYLDAVLSDLPTLYYPLDETSGTTAFDASPNAYDGAFGSVTLGMDGATVPQAESTAVSAGAGTEAVTTPIYPLPSGNGDRSVELWFRSGTAGDDWLWRYGNEFGLWYDDNRTLVVSTAAGGTANVSRRLPAGVNLLDVEWHHVVLTYDGDDSVPESPSGVLRLYVDGGLVLTSSMVSGVATTLDQGLFLGRRTGIYDEFAVYPSVLDAATVAEHFSVGLSTVGAECGVVPTDGYGLSVLDANPVSFLRLDKTVNDRVAMDSSGACRNGSFSTGSSAQPGGLLSHPSDGAASTGAAYYTATSTADGFPVGDAARTVETWFRSGTAGDDWLWRYGNEFGLWYDDNRTLVISTETADTNNVTKGLPSGVNLLDSEWHHLAVTYDSGVMRLYVDGALIHTATGVAMDTQLIKGLEIGRRTGIYDEFAVYPTALTATTIAEHYAIARTSDGVTCAAPPTDPYGVLVTGEGASAYYRLGDRIDTAAGRAALDSSLTCVSGSITSAGSAQPGALVSSTDGAVSTGSATHTALASPVGFPSGNGDRSVELWFRSGTAGDDWLWRYGNEFGLWYDDNRTLVVSTAAGGTANVSRRLPAGVNLLDVEWHHVVLTYDGDDSVPESPSGVLRLYVDGGLVLTSSMVSGVATTLDQGLFLGRRTGIYDEFAVYPSVLDAATVAEHFSVGLSTVGAECGVVPTDGYGLSVLDANPVSFLRLDKTVNDRVAMDSSGACRNGSFSTGSSAQPGGLLSHPSDGAASTGAAYYTATSTADGFPVGDAARTVETWFRSGTAGDDWLWRYGNEFGLWYDDNRTLVISTETADTNNVTKGLPSGVNLLDSEWHHLAVTYDSGVMRLYVDGALIHTATGVAMDTQLIKGLEIGRRTGIYDEFAVYPTALTATTIAEHYAIARTSDGVTCAAPPTDPYGVLVTGEGASAYYRLGDRIDTAAGRAALDSSLTCVSGSITSAGSAQPGALVSSTDGAVSTGSATHTALASPVGFPSGNGDRSVELWFRSGTAGDDWLWRYGNEFGLWYDDNRTLVVSTAAGGTANVSRRLPAGVNLLDVEWHHVVLTYDGDDSVPESPSGVLRLYVDGGLVLTSSMVSGVATTLDQGLFLGRRTGIYDEFAVYPSVLDAATVAEHFSVGLSTVGAECGVVPTDGYGLSVLDANPVSFLRLDKTVNDRVAMDSSGACRNGSFSTGSSAQPGGLLSHPSDGAASTGAAYYTATSTADGFPVGDAARTVETWFRSGTAGDDWLWRYGNEFGLWYDDNRTLVISTETADTNNVTKGLPSGVNLLDSEWHHLAVTYDSGVMRLYVDGALIHTATGVAMDTQLIKGLEIGRRTGIYDEFAVYPTALTATTIAEHYETARKVETLTSLTGPEGDWETGADLMFTATVVLGTPDALAPAPTGLVEFIDDNTSLGTAVLDAGGVASLAVQLPAGNHRVTARYLGDATYSGSASEPIERIVIVTGLTETSLSLNAPSVLFGDPLTGTVEVVAPNGGGSVPTGNVAIVVDGTQAGFVILVNGSATFSVDAGPVGSHDIYASFLSDINFDASESSVTTYEVTKSVPAVEVSGPATASFSEPVLVTATVTVGSDAAPVSGGTVVFLDGTTELGSTIVAGGVAEFTVDVMSIGTRSLTASFLGSPDVEPAISQPFSIEILRAEARVVIEATPNPVASGQSSLATVFVSPLAPAVGTPTGSVELFLDGASQGLASLVDGAAAFPIDPQSLGLHELSADFLPDPGWLPASAAAITLNVRDTTSLALAVDKTDAVVGELVTLTATPIVETPEIVPTGQVQFHANGELIATLDLDTGGVAILETTSLSLGDNSVAASYLGDLLYDAAISDPVLIGVSEATSQILVDTSPNPAGVGDEVTMTANVTAVAPGSGTPSGFVTLTIDGDPVGVVELTNGAASLTTSFAVPGDRIIGASYGGDSNFVASSTVGVVQTVAAATETVLTLDPSLPRSNIPVTLLATVTSPDGIPTGSVAFTVDGVSAGSADLSAEGVASVQTGPIGAGDHTFEAVFTSAAWGPSSDAIDATVLTAETTSTLSLEPSQVVFGQDALASISVLETSGGPAEGFVSLFDNATLLATTELATDGSAVVSISGLDVGSHSLRVQYGGSAQQDPSTSADVTFVVSKAATTTLLSTESPPIAPNQTLDIAVSVEAVAPGFGVADGLVSISSGGVELDSVLTSGGVAEVALTAPATLGPWELTATFQGNESFEPSTSEILVQQVNEPAPIDVVTPLAPTALGSLATFAVTVNGNGTDIPTGFVELYDGEKLYARSDLVSGSVDLATTGLLAGERLLRVEYSGDAVYAAGAIEGIAHEVLPAPTSVLLYASPSPAGQNQDVRVTAAVIPDVEYGPAMTGFISFFADGTLIAVATVDGNGVASSTVRFADLGTENLTASFGGDTNYLPGGSAPVSIDVLEPVIAAFETSEVTGVAPLAVTVDASATTGDAAEYRWDFGDGTLVTDTQPIASHVYESPGVFTISLTVSKQGLVDYASEVVVVAEDAPLLADAGEDRTVGTGTQITFDGRESSPEYGIDTVVWDFGDGSNSSDLTTTHTYTQPGSYVARLTIFNDGESSVDTANVTVIEPTAVDGVAVTVQTSTGTRVPNAQVLVIDNIDGRFEAVTDDTGVGILVGLADTQYAVYAIADGYQPGKAEVTVVDGQGEATVTIDPGELVDTEVTVRRLDPQEAAELGVDLNDPDNSFVFEFEMAFGFVRLNSAGRIVASEGCDEFTCERSGSGGERVYGSVSPNGKQMWWIVIPGQASWLKEFFEVKLVVMNLTSPDFALTDGVAHLNLPDGMSLAPTYIPQELSIPMNDIVGGEQDQVTWIIRGDEAGEYNISATFAAQLFPFGTSLSYEAVAATPVKVWGEQALALDVIADDFALANYPYRVTATLTNISDIDVYNPTLQFQGDYSVDDDGNVTQTSSKYVFQPRQQLLWQQESLSPGESITAELIVVPFDTGRLALSQSMVRFVGGNASPPTSVSAREAEDPENIPELKGPDDGVQGFGDIELAWDPAPNHRYRLFVAPPGSPFPAEPYAEFEGELSAVLELIPGQVGMFALSMATSDNGEMIHNALVATAGATTTTSVEVTNTCNGELNELTIEASDSRRELQGGEIHQVRRVAVDGEWQTLDTVVHEFDLSGQSATELYVVPQDIALLGEERPFTYPVLVVEDDDVILDVVYETLELHASGFYVRVWNVNDRIPDEELDGPEAGSEIIVYAQSNGVSVIDPCNWEDLIPEYEVEEILSRLEIALGRNCVPADSSGASTWTRLWNSLKQGACMLDPVNPSTGNLVSAEMDASYPGAGVTFSFDRTYNSQDERVGPLGKGWIHAYDMALEPPTTPDQPVILRMGDGARAGFFPSGTDDAGARLYTVDGSEVVVISRPVGEIAYTMQFPGFVQYDFNDAGELVRIKDRNALGVDLVWTDGQLQTITDEAGRIVTLEYTDERLTKVMLPDERFTEYRYEGELLRFVDDLSGGTTEYVYDAEGRLIEEWNENGDRMHRTTYGADGRVTEQINELGGTSLFDWDPDTETATVTAPDQGQTILEYDGLTLVAARDAELNWSRYVYDEFGHLAEVTDGKNRLTTMVHDQQGNIVKRTGPAPLLLTEEYGYDDYGNRTFSIDRDQNRTDYTYDTLGRLETITGPEGRSLEYDYDEFGLLRWSEDSLGRRTTFDYDEDFNLSQRCDPLLRCTDYDYDSAGRLDLVTGPDEATVSFTYDAMDRRETETDPNEHTTTYDYYADGTLWKITDQENQIREFKFNAMGQITQEWIGENTPSVYEYDDMGRLKKATTPAGDYMKYEFDRLGRLKKETNGRDATWEYEYDEVGNQIWRKEPGEFYTRIYYDAANRPDEIVDPESGVTKIEYDGTGDITKIIDPNLIETSIEYDGLNRAYRIVDNRDDTTELDFDAAGQLKSVTNPDGGVTTFFYNDAGEQTSTVEPRGNVEGANPDDYRTTYLYDLAGYLEEMIDPYGSVTGYVYDDIGNLEVYTDAEGKTTTYNYDDVDRVTEVIAHDGATTTYFYDSVGDLTERTDPRGNVTTYEYDDAHRLRFTTDPLGNVWETQYDAAGNVEIVTDPLGETITAEYTPRNLVELVDFSDPLMADISYTHDDVGRVKTMTDGFGTEVYGYDDGGRFKSIERNGSEFRYLYDEAGNIKERVYPDATTIDYLFDESSRVEQITVDGMTSSFDYDKAGLPDVYTLANDLSVDFDFDPLARLEAWQVGSEAAPVAFQSFAFDKVGNPLSELTSFGFTEYQYDDRHRLAEETSDTEVADARYQYDLNGNRIERAAEAGVPEALTYDEADRLVSKTEGTEITSFEFDDKGNLLGDGEWTYHFDQLNRLVRADRPTITSDQYSSIILADAPAAYWPLSGPDADATYDDLAGAAGPLTGPASEAPLAISDGAVTPNDGSVHFDGANDRIDLTNVDSQTVLSSGAWTLEFWMRANPDAVGQFVKLDIPGPQKPWTIGLQGSGELRLTRDKLKFETNVSVATNDWVHVALVSDGTSVRWVIDGTETNRHDIIFKTLDPAPVRALRFGAGATADLDEVAIYPTEISNSRLAERAAGVADYPEHVLFDSPDMYWRLGEPQGAETVIDSSDGGHDAQIRPVQVPTYTAGAVGSDGALSFDAINDSLSVADSTALRLDGAFTVEWWMRSDTAVDPGTMVLSKPDNAGGWQIQRAIDGGLEYVRDGRVYASDPDLISEGWAHVALTYDGGELTWWVNGDARGSHSGVAAFTPGSGSDSFTLGGIGEARYDVDELAVHERALSAGELAERPAALEQKTTIEYGYGGNGLRLQKVVDGVATYYQWDQLWGLPQVAMETGDGEQRTWVFGPQGPLQVKAEGDWYFTHQDVLGSTVAISDASGNTLSRIDYDAYGNAATRVDYGYVPDGLERFGDGTWEEELGLWFLRARYYNPELGMFISTDPIDTAVGDSYVSRYSFVNGQPTTLVDPSGLKAFDISKAAALDAWDATVEFMGGVGEVFHAALDVLGLIPVIGEAFDVINGVWYAIEGRPLDAALSFAALIPLAGSLGTLGRLGAKSGDEVLSATRLVSRGGDEAFDLSVSLSKQTDSIKAFSHAGDDLIDIGFAGRYADEGISNASSAIKYEPPCNSFVAGTLVLMADGSLVPIEDVQPGDMVQSGDPALGTVTERQVEATITGTGWKLIVAITSTDGGLLLATDEHPMWEVTTQSWINAEDLRPGHQLLSSDGDPVEVASTESWFEWETVHNLTVADENSYWVSISDLSVLVHNVADRCPIYTPDSLGRTEKVTAYIDPSVLGTGSSASVASFGSGFDRSHLIAKVFGGPGGNANMMGLFTDVNRGTMASFERNIAQIVRETGAHFDYSVFVTYLGDTKIADQVLITAVNKDTGDILEIIIQNSR